MSAFELKNGSGFCLQGFIAGARFEHTTTCPGALQKVINIEFLEEVVSRLTISKTISSKLKVDFCRVWL